MDKKIGEFMHIHVRMRKTPENQHLANRYNNQSEFVDAPHHIEHNVSLNIIPEILEHIDNHEWEANFSETEAANGQYDCIIISKGLQDFEKIRNVIMSKYHIIPVRFFHQEVRRFD